MFWLICGPISMRAGNQSNLLYDGGLYKLFHLPSRRLISRQNHFTPLMSLDGYQT